LKLQGKEDYKEKNLDRAAATAKALYDELSEFCIQYPSFCTGEKSPNFTEEYWKAEFKSIEGDLAYRIKEWKKKINEEDIDYNRSIIYKDFLEAAKEHESLMQELFWSPSIILVY